MKLNIVGASGSGTTTLADAVARAQGWTHLDVDDFYWVPTDPPFQEKLPVDVRQAALASAAARHDDVVVSGSLVSWGDRWSKTFDLVVFLYIPVETRIARLRERERARYGARLDEDPQAAARSAEFLAWSRRYEEPTFEGRSLSVHRRWLETVSGTVLSIEGDTSRDARLHAVLDAVRALQ